jgi:SulP family sulfate permease
VAVELGLVLAVVLFVRRQSGIFRADELARTEQQLTYRLFGSLFFGAVAKIDPIVAEVEKGPKGMNVMLDASQLISLDTTGLDALEQLHKALEKRGGHLSMVGLNEQPSSLIHRTGFAARLHTCQ